MTTKEYQLLVDTWESGGEIDEAVYKANNIAGIIIRLNDMNGGHHMDTGFWKQWNEAENFLRVPYFVYNPWKKAAGNFEWLIEHCPDDAHSVMVDIEVRKSDYSPAAYASQVDAFMDMVYDKWGTRTIYTGAWFLDYLSFWPANADYWWAQYPYKLYPSSGTKLSWEYIREIIETNSYYTPFNSDKIPGKYKMWQISGDKIIAPGCAKPMDINIFPGSMEKLREFMGYPAEEPTPEPDPEPDPGYADEVAEIVLHFESGRQETFVPKAADADPEPDPEPDPPDPEPEPEPVPSTRRLFRVLHDHERPPWGTEEPRWGMPEVYNLQAPKPNNPNAFDDCEVNVPATRAIQTMMWEIFKHGTPDFSEARQLKAFKRVYGSGRAFMNHNGMDTGANYINNENLDAKLPNFDKVRLCGGATVSGEVIGKWLKVDTLESAVTLEYLLARPWLYFEAIVVERRPKPFPQVEDVELDIYNRAYIPLISAVPGYLLLENLEEVSEIADPYMVK